MASISTVITLGYGSFGSVNLIPTLGYGIGAAPQDPFSKRLLIFENIIIIKGVLTNKQIIKGVSYSGDIIKGIESD